MVKRNPFGIQVTCEANKALKEFLEDGNPSVWDEATAAWVRPNRPQDQFQLPQRRSWMDDDGRGCPDHYYSNFRPERTWRCTLGVAKPLLADVELTNMCAVLDTHCAPYDPEAEGYGLKPPTLNEHASVVHSAANPRKGIEDNALHSALGWSDRPHWQRARGPGGPPHILRRNKGLCFP